VIGGQVPSGAPRNGLPERTGYVYRGNGPFIADEGWPQERRAVRRAALRAASQERARLRQAAMEGRCPDCTYPLDSVGHEAACGA
jgi:hypothetical protein